MALFDHLHDPCTRSMLNEYLYQTGAKDTEIYAKMTAKFEQR